MTELKIELSDTLLNELRQVAVKQFGANDRAAVSRVVATALALRLESIHGGDETANLLEEPIIEWSPEGSANSSTHEEEINRWLFREEV